MSEPQSVLPTGAWAFWHPEHQWGLPVPVLWASKETAVAKAKETGVWPPKHGWNLIRVVVAAPSMILHDGSAPSEGNRA